MQVSISQAHKMTGVARSTIYKDIEAGKIWLRKLKEKYEWIDIKSLLNIDSFRNEYLPEIWINESKEALSAGHNGGDYCIAKAFAKTIGSEISCPIGIHEAMVMTLPGLISQESIKQDGHWLNVPDSRTW